MVLLAILFLATAILYSSVGFGGGSTYLALLLIWGVPYFIFPVIALSCNIIVVSGNCFNYIRAKNLNLKLNLRHKVLAIRKAFRLFTLNISRANLHINRNQNPNRTDWYLHLNQIVLKPFYLKEISPPFLCL